MLLYLNRTIGKKTKEEKTGETESAEPTDSVKIEETTPSSSDTAQESEEPGLQKEGPHKRFQIKALMPLMILVVLLMGAGSVYLMERLMRIQSYTSTAKLDDMLSLSGRIDNPQPNKSSADAASAHSETSDKAAQPPIPPSPAKNLEEAAKPSLDLPEPHPQPKPAPAVTEPAPTTHPDVAQKDTKGEDSHPTHSKEIDSSTTEKTVKEEGNHEVKKTGEEGAQGAAPQKSPVTPPSSFNKDSLQPYMEAGAHPFVRNVNPQFFLEGPKNQEIRVAIVLSGVGINQELSDEILSNLPEEVTVAVSPYADNVSESIQDVKLGGNAVLLQMPWEDEDPLVDQGFLTIRTYQLKENLIDTLTKMEIFANQADGFLAEGGARLMRASIDLSTVLEFIASKKNFLVAPPDTMMTQLHELAPRYKLNYVSTTITDPERNNFDPIEKLVKRTGFAVIVFTINPKVLEQINLWIKMLEDAKIKVVPITQIISLRKD